MTSSGVGLGCVADRLGGRRDVAGGEDQAGGTDQEVGQTVETVLAGCAAGERVLVHLVLTAGGAQGPTQVGELAHGHSAVLGDEHGLSGSEPCAHFLDHRDLLGTGMFCRHVHLLS
jgi:hypothetical protein